MIWEDVGKGFVGMKNITSTIINPESMIALKYKDEWLEFVDLFINWEQGDFHKEYLPKHLIRKIKTMSVRWFKN